MKIWPRKNAEDNMKNKVRFFIANILDDIFPKACWADLATWSIGYTEFKDVSFSNQCEFLDDRCYCGKQYKEKQLTKSNNL